MAKHLEKAMGFIDYEVHEVCPYCDNEICLRWDIETMGMMAYCPICSNEMLLCSQCELQSCDNCPYSNLHKSPIVIMLERLGIEIDVPFLINNIYYCIDRNYDLFFKNCADEWDFSETYTIADLLSERVNISLLTPVKTNIDVTEIHSTNIELYLTGAETSDQIEEMVKKEICKNYSNICWENTDYVFNVKKGK